MSLFIIMAIVIIIMKVLASRGASQDGLGAVLGLATEYDECPVCGQTSVQSARGQGEVIVRGGHYVVRQYHVCGNCGARALWHRRLDQFVWTVNRSGIHGIPYHSHG